MMTRAAAPGRPLGLPLLATAVAIAAGLAALVPASAQDAAAAAAAADRLALTAAREAVLARRLLMSSIGSNNDAIHDILDGVRPPDQFELRSRLASISAMMRAMPSLYRAQPDPWTPEGEDLDPTFVSLALPALWEEFPAFEAMALQSWQTAQDASLAPQDEVLALVEELEVQCEACHARFRRAFETFDFDTLPPPDAGGQ